MADTANAGADAASSETESESAAETSSGGEGSKDTELGAFFQSTRKKKKKASKSTPAKSVATEDTAGTADANSSSGKADSQCPTEIQSDNSAGPAPPELGSFFDPPKRRAKLKKVPSACSTSSSADMPETPQAGGKSPASSMQRWADLLGGSAKHLEDPPEQEEDDCPRSLASSRAASRNAWKQRGRSEGDASPTPSQEASVSSSSQSPPIDAHPPPPKKKTVAAKSSPGRRTASGLYRPAARLAMDSTRCHWLLPPESLLIRVDPETSAFLQRQWLGIQASGVRGAGAATGRGNAKARRRSIPARLHAGWLAQTLRPRGWLARIPEDEARCFPMPLDLIGEPDRGMRRPSVATVERVILEELSED